MKMVFGNPDELAIVISIEEQIASRAYGSFLLSLGGAVVGNQQDRGVYLNACINWLSKFVNSPGNTYAPDLLRAPKLVVWRKIVEPVFGPVEEDSDYPSPYARFHISNLGMSAFNAVILVLVDDGKDKERYLWQQDNRELYDFVAPFGSLAHSAKLAISWFDEEQKNKTSTKE
jgi:hypothetical protein